MEVDISISKHDGTAVLDNAQQSYEDVLDSVQETYADRVFSQIQQHLGANLDSSPWYIAAMNYREEHSGPKLC